MVVSDFVRFRKRFPAARQVPNFGYCFVKGTAFLLCEKTALKNQRCRLGRKKRQAALSRCCTVDFRNVLGLMGIPGKTPENEEKMTDSVKKPKVGLSAGHRVRVRIEYSVTPTVSGVGFKTDKKLMMLKILLGERFGQEAGYRAYTDWLLLAANLNQVVCGPGDEEEIPDDAA